MTKHDIIRAAARATGETQSRAEAIIAAALEVAANALTSGEAVTLHGFGTFERRERAARTARNFRTGEPIQVAAAQTVTFAPAAALKRRVSSGE